MGKEILISHAGLKALEDELDELKTFKRKEIAEKIKVALSFGDLSSDDAKTYPVDNITQTNLARGVYWYPVTEAVDDSGVPADVDRLNGMLDASVQTLFVTPNAQQGTIVYADQFSEKTVDGKKVIALVIKGGSELAGLNAGVDMQISVFSVGGAQATLPVKIARDSVIKDMEIDIPDLYVGKPAEIKLSATDTDGKKVDLYKVTSNLSLATQTAPAANNGGFTGRTESSAALRFWDTAQGQNAIGTKINISVGNLACAWELVRNATNHEVSLKITPAATVGNTEGYLNMTGTTAAFTAITKANIKINPARVVDGITGLAGSIPTKVLNTNTKQYTLTGGNTTLTYNDGSNVDAATAGALYIANDATLATLPTGVASVVADGVTFDAGTSEYLLYSMELTGITPGTTAASDIAWNGTTGEYVRQATGAGVAGYAGNGFFLVPAAATSTTVGGSAEIQIDRTAVTGKSDTLKIKLYKVSKVKDAAATADTRVELLATKSISFTVENEDTASYELKVDATDNVLYAGKTYSDALPFKITTSTGAEVAQSKLKSVKVVNTNNDGAKFDYNDDGGIICTAVSNAKPGTVNKATINATIESNGDSIDVSQEFSYQTDDPIPTHMGLFGYKWGNEVAAKTVTITGDTIGDTSPFIRYMDQYYTDCGVDGLNIDVTIGNYKTTGGGTAVFSGCYYYNGVVYLHGSGALAANDTFQVTINGGKGLTLYVTAGAKTLTPATASFTVVSNVNDLNDALATAKVEATASAPYEIQVNNSFTTDAATTEIPANTTLVVNGGKTLVLGADLAINGTLENYGTVKDGSKDLGDAGTGRIINNGTIEMNVVNGVGCTFAGAVSGEDAVWKLAQTGVTTTDEVHAALVIVAGGTYTGSNIINLEADATGTAPVSITAGSVLNIASGVTLTQNTGALTIAGNIVAADDAVLAGDANVTITGTGINALGVVSSTGNVTISAGTNTIKEINKTGGNLTFDTAGTTTVDTWTAAVGTNTIGAGATVKTTGNIAGKTITLAGGTLDTSAVTGALTATIAQNAASTINVAAAADLTANQTFTTTAAAATGVTTYTIAGAAGGTWTNTGYLTVVGTLVGNATADTWTATNAS